jgi:hypothetical protein
MITCECAYCGAAYKAARSSAKYCSDSCKTMANRKRRQAEASSLSLRELRVGGKANLKALLNQAEFDFTGKKND